MTSPEAQTSRLLLTTANLLNSVAEAAWTNDIPSPARWELHRIGTEAYLAQRDILGALGQGLKPVAPLPGIDIAAALEEAAQNLTAISKECQYVDNEALKARVSSLALRALALAPTRFGEDEELPQRVRILACAVIHRPETCRGQDVQPQEEWKSAAYPRRGAE